MSNITGTIVYLSKIDKGYGFVRSEGIEDQIFFHARDLKEKPFKDLQVGEKLSFTIENGQRGKLCKNIVVINE